MGFFQDLKQDLSQTVTDNMSEDMELEGDELALSTDAAPISSEDLLKICTRKEVSCVE